MPRPHLLSLFLLTLAAGPAFADTPTDQEFTDAAKILAAPPSDYTSCMSPGDCMILKDACGADRAINKTHADQFATLARRQANTNCGQPIIARQEPDVTCDQGTCTIPAAAP